MAVQPITVTNISRAGLDLTAGGTSGESDGMTFVNDGNTLLRVKNTNATALDVGLVIQRTVDGRTAAARVVNIAQNKDYIIGPFPVTDYGSVVSITLSHELATVTAWAYSLVG